MASAKQETIPPLVTALLQAVRTPQTTPSQVAVLVAHGLLLSRGLLPLLDDRTGDFTVSSTERNGTNLAILSPDVTQRFREGRHEGPSVAMMRYRDSHEPARVILISWSALRDNHTLACHLMAQTDPDDATKEYSDLGGASWDVHQWKAGEEESGKLDVNLMANAMTEKLIAKLMPPETTTAQGGAEVRTGEQLPAPPHVRPRPSPPEGESPPDSGLDPITGRVPTHPDVGYPGMLVGPGHPLFRGRIRFDPIAPDDPFGRRPLEGSSGRGGSGSSGRGGSGRMGGGLNPKFF